MTRTIIACVFGLTTALGVTSLYTLVGPAAFGQNLVVAVLLIVPIWIATLVTIFLSRTRRSTAVVLGLNIACYVAIWLLGRSAG